MANEKDYAALAAYVYNNERGVRGPVNRLDLPSTWLALEDTPARFSAQSRFNNGTLGFTGGAYINAAGEIVIAYKGTDFLLDAGRKSEFVGDMVTNVGLALGRTAISSQLIQAAEYYAEVKRWAISNGYNSANITFTGHSLGGGIASVMTAWTGQSSSVFAQAPFQISGLTPSTFIQAKSAVERVLGTSDEGFSAFVADPLTVLNQREPLVTNRYVQGEFLELLRTGGTTINGTNLSIDIGIRPFNIGQGLALHSMNLHAAFLYDDRLRALAKSMPELIPALLDGKLYASDPNSRKKDLITTLVNDQLRQGFSADSALKRFTSELMKLQGDSGMAAQPAVRTALIAAGMDYFYNNEPSATTRAIFSNDNNGIHLNLSDLGIDKSKSKALPLLVKSMRPFIDSQDVTEGQLYAQDAWHIQSGTSGMIWSGGNTIVRDVAMGGAQTDVFDGGGGADILIGGAGSDFLTGGAGTDTLIGGVGDDVLNGGTGNDALVGGGGADIYQFTAGDGKDTITDSDGQGTIQIDGQTLGTAQGAGKRNVWVAEVGAGQYVGMSVYDDQSSTTGNKLVITKGARSRVRQGWNCNGSQSKRYAFNSWLRTISLGCRPKTPMKSAVVGLVRGISL